MAFSRDYSGYRMEKIEGRLRKTYSSVEMFKNLKPLLRFTQVYTMHAFFSSSIKKLFVKQE